MLKDLDVTQTLLAGIGGMILIPMIEGHTIGSIFTNRLSQSFYTGLELAGSDVVGQLVCNGMNMKDHDIMTGLISGTVYSLERKVFKNSKKYVENFVKGGVIDTIAILSTEPVCKITRMKPEKQQKQVVSGGASFNSAPNTKNRGNTKLKEDKKKNPVKY